MKKEETVVEGSNISLNEAEIEALEDIGLSSEKEAFSVREGVLQLNPGFVGVLSTPQRNLIVNPRHNSFNFNDVMKMYFYVNFDSLPSEDSVSYSIASSNFLLNIAQNFVNELQYIERRGLIGRYKPVHKEENFVKGKIDFEKSKISQNKILKLQTIHDEHTPDNDPNKIIKYCIEHLQKIVNNDQIITDLKKHEKVFREISNTENIRNLNLEDTFLSSHEKHYQEILKLCKIIIENLYYSDLGDGRKGVSFLINYDTLFEEFVRSLLMRDYGEDFEYWGDNGEKTYTEYYDSLEGNRKKKKYLPDILYNYNESSQTAQTVLDVKNKVDRIFSNPDVYQMKFYTDMLNTDQAILIYPTNKDLKPSKIKIEDGESNLEITAVFLKLKGNNKDFLNNIEKFSNEVYNVL